MAGGHVEMPYHSIPDHAMPCNIPYENIPWNTDTRPYHTMTQHHIDT